MDTQSVQSQTAVASTSSSPEAGNYNSPATPSATDGANPKEDSKFKDPNMETSESTTTTNTDVLLIEDSTLDEVPIHLENLFRSLDINKSSSADVLMAIIYGIALECSFAATDEESNLESIEVTSRQMVASTFNTKCVRLLSNMPSNIFNADKMTYSIRLQLFFEPASVCLMTGIITGDLLILNLSPEDENAPGTSICLSIGRYVLDAKGKAFASRLRKLPELSFKLRQNILFPIRKYLIQKDEFVVPYPSLEYLPCELYTHLYSFMSRRDLMRVLKCNKRLYDTVQTYEHHKAKLKIVKTMIT